MSNNIEKVCWNEYDVIIGVMGESDENNCKR